MDSTCHALFFCATIKHLWKNTSFNPNLRGDSLSCTLDICLWWKKQFSKSVFEEFTTHTWAVWREKQSYLHGDKKKPIIVNISWGSTVLDDFQNSRAKEKIEDTPMKGSPESKWKPPTSGTFMLNVDAAVKEESHQYGIGGVVRDNQGRLLLAFGKQINQPISVVHGELLAIREGIILLYEKGFSDVQVATDSLLAVQTINSDLEDLGYTGLCTTDIKERLKKPIISDLIHVKITANKVAHNVARFAMSTYSPFVWVNGVFPL